MDPLNVLLLGSGGREHAIATSLQKSKRVSQIFAVPGNAGTEATLKTTNVSLSDSDFPALVDFCKSNQINLVIPGSEIPLVNNISQVFKNIGIPCFGPSGNAAQIEGSKRFAKDFMKRHGIPTASYESFTDYSKAVEYVKSNPKIVIKASGLAAGKGVILPTSIEEALSALESIMVKKEFGSAGNEVVIEELMVGEEVSLLCFSDGYTAIQMPAAQDHKRIFDNDQGGMGAYAPTPIYTNELAQIVKKTVLEPTISGMRRDGYPFIGVLYIGLMITSTGPKVVEYNCRFGDPETQVILPLLDDSSDLCDIMMACCEGRLDSVSVSFSNDFAVTIVMSSKGYPGKYSTGIPIEISESDQNCLVYHAGTKKINKSLVTNGGRVLSVTATSKTLSEALSHAYSGIKGISFEGSHYRKDIGAKALSYKQKSTTYADAGVSITHGNNLVDMIKPLVKSTSRIGSDAIIGGFGGLFDVKAAGFVDAVLVSGTDGVGTKLIIAQEIGIHDTIGIDLVAMSVNDVLVQGAEPLFFLDYFACSVLDVNVARDVVAGIVKGNCALIGGETAEMPGLYSPGEYDLAGFVVGAVERTRILPNLDTINPGDIVLGLASSGVHSNGFSLVRHVVAKTGLKYTDKCPFDQENTLGKALLAPTRIYVRQLLSAINTGLIKSMAHITGGGLLENIPRALNNDRGVILDAASWPLLPVFKWIKEMGSIDDHELSRTFNCGIGMVIIVSPENVSIVQGMLQDRGEDVYQIGKVVVREAASTEEAVVVLNTGDEWN